MFDVEFWKNFLSNALATLVGVIIGIPIALWINKIQQKSTETAEHKILDAEANSRKAKILRLVKEELASNRNLIGSILTDTKDYDFDDIDDNTVYRGIDDPTKITTADDLYRLRTELWKAFSDGGELEWIQNPDLMQAIALAYESIRMIVYLYDLLVLRKSSDEQILEFVSRRNFGSGYGVIRARLKKSMETALEHIDNALTSINNELSTV